MKHKDILEGDFKLGSKKSPRDQEITRKEKAKVKQRDKDLAQLKTSLIQERISLGF